MTNGTTHENMLNDGVDRERCGADRATDEGARIGEDGGHHGRHAAVESAGRPAAAVGLFGPDREEAGSGGASGGPVTRLQARLAASAGRLVRTLVGDGDGEASEDGSSSPADASLSSRPDTHEVDEEGRREVTAPAEKIDDAAGLSSALVMPEPEESRQKGAGDALGAGLRQKTSLAVGRKAQASPVKRRSPRGARIGKEGRNRRCSGARSPGLQQEGEEELEMPALEVGDEIAPWRVGQRLEVFYTDELVWFPGRITMVDWAKGHWHFTIAYDPPAKGKWHGDAIQRHRHDEVAWRFEEGRGVAGAPQAAKAKAKGSSPGLAARRGSVMRSLGFEDESDSEGLRSMGSSVSWEADREAEERPSEYPPAVAPPQPQVEVTEVRAPLGDVTNAIDAERGRAPAGGMPLAQAMLGDVLPIIDSVEMAVMAEGQLADLLGRPAARQPPEGPSHVRFRQAQGQLESTLRAIAGEIGMSLNSFEGLLRRQKGEGWDRVPEVLRLMARYLSAHREVEVAKEARRHSSSKRGGGLWSDHGGGERGHGGDVRGGDGGGRALKVKRDVGTKAAPIEISTSGSSDVSSGGLDVDDELGVRSRGRSSERRASDRSRRWRDDDRPAVYLEQGGGRKTGDEAVQSSAFHDAVQRIAVHKHKRKTLDGLRAAARARHETGNDVFFSKTSDAMAADADIAVALTSIEVSEPKGASAREFVTSVVRFVRAVQAERVLAVTSELRDVLGYDAAVEDLAKAICHGRWRTLDFKNLASPETFGAWVGKAQKASEAADWSTTMGLFYAMWEVIVWSYTAVHKYDRSAHRVLTQLCAETQQAVRGGMTTADAVAGLIAKFFAVLEEEVRALQRGSADLPKLAEVWERCQSKPFYRTFSLQAAANTIGGSAHMDKLNRRIAALEQERPTARAGTSWAAVAASRASAPAAEAKAGGGGGSASSGERAATAGGRASGGFIPAKELAEWQAANPGKCFYFHLKGHCPSGGKGAECFRGAH